LCQAAKVQHIYTLKGHLDPVASVCFSPDGKRIFSKDSKGAIKIWDAVKGREIESAEEELPPDLDWNRKTDGKRLVYREGFVIYVRDLKPSDMLPGKK